MSEIIGKNGVVTPTGEFVEATDELEEGELYVLRKSKLEKIPKADEDGMRRVRVTEVAFQAASDIGKGMRKHLNGYKPDVSLVISALVLGSESGLGKEEVVKQFVLTLFEGASFEAVDNIG